MCSLSLPQVVIPVQVRYEDPLICWRGILDRSNRYAEAAAVLGKAKQEVAATLFKDLLKQAATQVTRFETWRQLVRRNPSCAKWLVIRSAIARRH